MVATIGGTNGEEDEVICLHFCNGTTLPVWVLQMGAAMQRGWRVALIFFPFFGPPQRGPLCQVQFVSERQLLPLLFVPARVVIDNFLNVYLLLAKCRLT